MSFDTIVVGGGTAGAVLAARLSEDTDQSVLLLEAGRDYPGEMPRELLDVSAAVTSGHNWQMQAIVSEDDGAELSGQLARIARVFAAAGSRPGEEPGGPRLATAGGALAARCPYPLGKVVGGGSAINGGLAFHARPEDYAAWTAPGNDRWSWEHVRPYIGRIEAADAGKPALPIEAAPVAGFTRLQEAFFETCLEQGSPRVDVRQGTQAGVGAIPKSVSGGQRVSTSRLYLAAARQRPNLTIRPQCLVDKILCERRGGAVTAAGVEALVEGRRMRFAAGRIVLAAGAIHSPAILLRSGIGAAAEVARAGGTPLLDLPGVGKNLVDHPAVSIWVVPREGACLAGEPVHQAMMQLRSAASGSLCDLQLFMLSAVPTRTLPPLREVAGADIAAGISAVVATPSSRGRVELLDCDPARNPRIHLNCLREPADLRRMMAAIRSAWSILRGPRLAGEIERIVLWNQGIVDADHLLEKVIRSTVRVVWHPVGTLRMGRDGDPAAVVDQRGRLYGCDNLTVADGSIMPAIPSVPTSLTCMLIGERMAALLRGQEGG
jgi:choline dehydrogenase